MPGPHGTSYADRQSRLAELVAQLERIEVERRNPNSALGPEILTTVAASLRTQIDLIESSEANDADEDCD